jgi:hypothetical protein
MKTAIMTLLTFGLLVGTASGDPWPAETWETSTNLTELDDGFGSDVSGAHFNPVTKRLWVADNGGQFVAMVPDGEGSYVVDYQDEARAYWKSGGDCEGITQVDYNENSVYIMAEREHLIRKYDTSQYGDVKLLHQWNIRPFVPAYNGAGPEGIAFVPDEWLAKSGFTKPDGTAFPKSSNGMGGLMLVAHQNGGKVYAFDLGVDSDVVSFIGAYGTNTRESSGLEFNRSSGKLYVWHNVGGNSLEEVSLKSTNGTFDSLRTWASPKGGNLECIAIMGNLLVLCDDSNANGFALMLYKEWRVDTVVLDIRVAAGRDDAEERSGRMSLGSSDLELTQDKQFNQYIGIRFRRLPIPAGVKIAKAYIQFSTGEPNKPMKMAIHGEAVPNSAVFSRDRDNISGRVKTAEAIEWVPGIWQTRAPPEDQRSADISALVQARVDAPGWKPGNAMSFIISSVEAGGLRLAVSTNGEVGKEHKHAPRLHIEYDPAP